MLLVLTSGVGHGVLLPAVARAEADAPAVQESPRSVVVPEGGSLPEESQTPEGRTTRAGRFVPGLAGGRHEASDGSEDYQVDGQGRVFRVRFDPGSRIRLGGGLFLEGPARSPDLSLELAFGFAYRSMVSFGQGEERIRWQLDQQGLSGWVRPRVSGCWGWPELDLTLYQGNFLRHSEAPYMVLPSNPPRRLFFPFDLGVETFLGQVQLPALGEGRVDQAHFGVAGASLLFDPWRTGRPGNSLELGWGLRYDLDLGRAPGQDSVDLTHRLAPFTATSLRLRLQDVPGTRLLDLRGDLQPHWATRGGWQLAASVHARLERVLIALNDQPVSLVAECSWQHRPSPGWQDSDELRLLLALELGLQLHDRTPPPEAAPAQASGPPPPR
jgi:hypothetical protein